VSGLAVRLLDPNVNYEQQTDNAIKCAPLLLITIAADAMRNIKDELMKFLTIGPETSQRSNQTGPLQLPKNSYVIDPIAKESVFIEDPGDLHTQKEVKKMINSLSTREGGMRVFKIKK
jgi:hypothetical protein